MSEFKEVDLEALSTQETDPFQAWGYCRLKVQRGEEILAVRVKIQSIPHEVLESLRKKAPKPPSKVVSLDGTVADARNLGGSSRGRAIVPDTTDPKYLEALETYNIAMTQEVVGRGVASQLTLKSGSAAATPDERYQALEERGLSGQHFTELAQAILRLTDWTDEEREKFL